MKPNEEFIQTRHDFTDDELLALGDEIASRLQEKSDIQSEKKIVTRAFSDKIKVIDKEMERIGQCIADKFELRETRCRVEYDVQSGKKRFYDAETGVHHLTQDMDDNDYKLFNEEED